MNKFRYIFLFLLLLLKAHSSSSQPSIHLTGIICDLETKLPLENVNVFAVNLKIGTISDAKGYFSMELPANTEATLFVSQIGTLSKKLTINIKRDTLIYLFLQKQTVELEEVSILSDSKNTSLFKELGREEIKQREILNLPSLMGSPDILRSVINLPGVSKGNEGDGGLYVRGGESSQNTIMLDDIEIMNPAHVLGMYSVFNPYTTQNISIYKAASPINYDQKLSSVLLVRSINKDTSQFKGTVNLGNILSDLAVNGSSKKKRFTYVLGLRKSYLEAYSKIGSLVVNKETGEYLKKNMLGFYDFNGKISMISGKRSTQSLSWYMGKDFLYFDGKKASFNTDIGWQNRGIALASIHHLGENKTFETTLSYTDYRFAFDGEIVDKKMNFQTDYSHLKFKSFYKQATDKITWIGGFGSAFYHLFPKNSTITSNLEENTKVDEFKALENMMFGSFEYSANSRWLFNVGIKLKSFMFLGPYKYYKAEDSIPIHYRNNQLVKTFILPDVSVSSSYSLVEHSVWKSSYMYNSQNIHQGIVASIALPADLFVPTSRLIKPEYSHTFATGIIFNAVFHKDFFFSIDAYYKSMHNLLIYRLNYNSAKPVQNIEDQFCSGIGWASGLEISLVKKYGAFTGNISTSISKSRRRFDEMNQGKWFDSKYDRIGDISTTFNYSINQKYSFNANWVFTGGMKTTLSPGRYWMMGSVMNDFDEVNNVRLPAYHRLDVGFNIRLASNYFHESLLNFSIMNLYNRKNPFLVTYGIEAPEDNPYKLRIFATQISLIPILPSISWKITF